MICNFFVIKGYAHKYVAWLIGSVICVAMKLVKFFEKLYN